MQVAVIGGGVIGVCSAYFLARAGHEVVVVEKQNNVAELASFGNPGVIAPGDARPWAAPGMPKKLLSQLFQSEAPVRFTPRMDRALWRWLRQWMRECDSARFQLNRERMQRVAHYSLAVLHEIRAEHQIDYEQTQGYLQLFRTPAELAQAESAAAFLVEAGIPHSLLDPEETREVEPGLSTRTPLVGALHLPQDEAGNCPLFTKQLKSIAQRMGVVFHFNAEVKALERDGGQVTLVIDERRFQADAVVLAAGAESIALLNSLGLRVPLMPVKGYSATVAIRDFEEAPRSALYDEANQCAITRMGARIRIAGAAEIGATDTLVREAAMRSLIRIGADWFPNAANYNGASFWSGVRAMLPDSVPLLGQTPIRNVYLNLGHGASGWTMAAGSGKILADIISGKAPEVDLDGLTLSRYG